MKKGQKACLPLVVKIGFQPFFGQDPTPQACPPQWFIGFATLHRNQVAKHSAHDCHEVEKF